MVNKVILIGRLGQDPKLNKTQSGKSVTNFSLATDEVYYDKEGVKQSRTEWHKVVVWDKTADNCSKFLKKGSLCYLEGRIQTNNWTDNDGNPRKTQEIQANMVKFMPDGKNKPTTKESGEYDAEQNKTNPDDDVPF